MVTLMPIIPKFSIKKPYLIVVLLLAVVSLIFLANTYLKWEYLTFSHGNKFISSSKNGFGNPNCLTAIVETDIDYLKVMRYENNQADVFVKSKDGLKILYSLKNIDGQWTHYYNDVCYAEVIYSPYGSADDIYWY
jgi:hypothetical protein